MNESTMRDWLHRYEFTRQKAKPKAKAQLPPIQFTTISAENLATVEQTLLALAKNNPALQVLVRNVCWQAALSLAAKD